MLYAARDAQGNICDLQPAPCGAAQERVQADNPDVLQFIHERWRQNELNTLDREFVRALEDTIELLIKKNLILFTELPLQVQEKMMRRKEIRQQGGFETGLLDNDIIRL